MASSKEYLLYVQELLREVDGISYKRMMGEYIIYKDSVIVGGIYDNNFLIKKTKSLENSGFSMQIPYPNAKPMLVVYIEDSREICEIINQVYNDLKK